MGADLYIREVFDANHGKWSGPFEQAVARRDRLSKDSPECRQAQREVDEYSEKMYEHGYFRDPYNDWDLLWQFELSWWNDIQPLLDDRCWLSYTQAQQVLAMLRRREPIFERNLAEFSPGVQENFRSRYAQLQGFLNQAVQLQLPIECSL
jgi:hypothetical protein